MAQLTPQDLFEPVDMPVDNLIIPDDIIDIENIETSAHEKAIKLVNKVKKLYFTKEELKADGYALSIIDRYIESVTLLEKMLISNSQLQDRLIKILCVNSSASSLYMSLTKIQDSIMDIQARITKEINELHESLNEIKNSGEEDDDEKEEQEIESKTAYRGGKDFLKSLKNDD